MEQWQKKYHAAVEEFKLKEKEFEHNVMKLNQNLVFSREVGNSIKNDYDHLQETFDKHGKQNVNTIQDLKENLEITNQKMLRLQVFKDDSDILWKEYKEKCDKEVADANEETEKMKKGKDLAEAEGLEKI